MHRFHIPVMGTSFSVDTPLRVAPLGISSVASIVDDDLLERVRRTWSEKLGRPYTAIPKDLKNDSRARRVRAYMDFLAEVVHDRFEAVRNGPELERYLRLLPEESPLKALYRRWQATRDAGLLAELRRRVRPGRIEANIMTKVDKPNYVGREPLPVEFNDAHAALRGFAESRVEGALCLSAGLNPRLYSYMAKFKDFFMDEAGRAKKEIILKVSDFRSALTQGKFLAKKGLWVSEYRLESGLNCGGHAFATPGMLMGPILEEFKRRRAELVETLWDIYKTALKKLKKPVPEAPPPIRITAQGGVGNAFEQRLLTEEYGLDSVGWGSPFLLVPEVTVVDEATRTRLSEAKEKDLYLSGASPLGVPFHSLKDAPMARKMWEWYESGKPGSPCPKGHLEFDTEFTEKPICTASRNYQYRKLKAIEESGMPADEKRAAIERVLEKQCLCVGLAESAHLTFNLEPQMPEGGAVSVCPGPNLAYFEGTHTLEEMVDHIYGRNPIPTDPARPHVFVKELRLYQDYLKDLEKGRFGSEKERTPAYLAAFRENLAKGARYYLENLERFGLSPWKDELLAVASGPAIAG